MSLAVPDMFGFEFGDEESAEFLPVFLRRTLVGMQVKAESGNDLY